MSGDKVVKTVRKSDADIAAKHAYLMSAAKGLNDVTYAAVFWDPQLQAIETVAAEFLAGVQVMESTENNVAEMLTQTRETIKRVNDLRLACSAPYRAEAQEWNKRFKDTLDLLNTANTFLTDQAKVLQAAKLEAQAAERAEREKEHAERMGQIHEAGARKIAEKEAEQASAQIAADLTAVASPLAKVKTKYYREVVVFDLAQVPREYLVADMARIKRDALGGQEIAGVRIEQREVLQARKIGDVK